MEDFDVDNKENEIGDIICSPMLSSVETVANRRRIIKPEYSPLSEVQDNRLHSPGLDRTSKAGLLLSTPLYERHSLVPDSWDEIRKLDEEEEWIERTQVVLKEDHLLYQDIAKEVVNSIIDEIPIVSMDDSNAECNNTEIDLGELDLPNNVNALGETKAVEVENLDDVVNEEKDSGDTGVDDITKEISNVQVPDHLEKSGVEEDNDFIQACSDLDVTVKEISADDNPTNMSERFPAPAGDLDDSSVDMDKTVCNDQNNDSGISDLQNNELTDTGLVSNSDLQIDNEMFKPAAEVFKLELDFLETCGSSDGSEHVSDLARQSLYVKFDPLVAARETEEVTEDSNILSNINPSDLLFQGPISGDDLLVMDTPPEKPVISRRALLSQTASSQKESGETPAATVVASVDNLFDLSPDKNISPEECEEKMPLSECEKAKTEEASVLVQPLLFSKEDIDKAVKEEREKLMNEWNTQSSLHEAEIEKLLEERNKAIEENKVVKTLMMEYEHTMAQMIKDRENEQSQQEKSNSEIVQERDQLQRDLNNTEKSFAHLHEKFEKLKSAVEAYKKNEEVLKKAVADLLEDLKTSEGRYQVLKKHAEEKLHGANVEINRVQKSYKAEIAGLQAALKREKTKVTSLQQNLDRKVSENKELTAICDELISKVGTVPQ